MTPSYSSTPEPAGTSLAAIARWPGILYQLHERLRPCFARPEPYKHALLYLQAVLSEIPRKNGWQIAEHARQLRPSGMQRLLSGAVWDQDGVRDELRALVKETLKPPPVLPEADAPDALFPILVLFEQWLPQTRQALGRGAAAVLWRHRTRRQLSGRRVCLLRDGPGACPH